MAIELGSGLSGRDHYDGLFRAGLDEEAELSKRSAVDRANSVQILLQESGINSATRLVELGAGTGSVISECRNRGVASSFTAVEYSSSAVDYLRRNTIGIDVIQADITAADFQMEGSIDILLISHVVEHLEDPHAFLAAARSKLDFSYAVIEVPLEDLPLSRLKALVKDRTKNLAGHVQFYTRKTFEDLLTSCDLEVVRSRTYFPIQTPDDLRLTFKKDQMPAWRYPLLWMTRRLIPQMVPDTWSRLYHANCAALCRKSR